MNRSVVECHWPDYLCSRDSYLCNLQKSKKAEFASGRKELNYTQRQTGYITCEIIRFSCITLPKFDIVGNMLQLIELKIEKLPLHYWPKVLD